MAKKYYVSVVVSFTLGDVVNAVNRGKAITLEDNGSNLIVITNEHPKDLDGVSMNMGCGYVGDTGTLRALVGKCTSRKAAIEMIQTTYPSAKKFNHVDGSRIGDALVVECYKTGEMLHHG